MENLEECCLEKLNKILSKFNLQIVIIGNRLNLYQCHYRLIYKNDYANRLMSWLSISDMLFTCRISRYTTNSTIFEFLNSYYEVVSAPSFNILDLNKDTLSKFQACSDAYKEIEPLKSNSFEEFLINCDLLGV